MNTNQRYLNGTNTCTPLKTRFVSTDFFRFKCTNPLLFSLWFNGRSRSGIPLPLFQCSLCKNVKGKIRFFRFLCTNPCTLLLNALATDPGLAHPLFSNFHCVKTSDKIFSWMKYSPTACQKILHRPLYLYFLFHMYHK